MTIDMFWQEFLAFAKLDTSTEYFAADFFGYNEELANELLQWVLTGKKTASPSSFLAYEVEGEQLPQVGDHIIVTDWDGVPHCVIRIYDVTILPFNEITFDICKREGGYENLETWQEDHRHIFTEEGKKVGYEFTEVMPVVYENFEVVFAIA